LAAEIERFESLETRTLLSGPGSPGEPLAVGQGPHSVATGDFNGDGRPDLVTANSGSGDVSGLVGPGDGSVRPEARAPGEDRPVALAVEDLDANGRLDLVICDNGGGFEDGSIEVLLGNGDGSFGEQARFLIGTYPNSVAVADVDGDGRPDIVASNRISHD